MELDLEMKQQLAELLAKPTLVTQAHVAMLAELTKAYPYYQPLHLLLAKASLGSAEHEHQLATAALYNNGSLLHQIIYRPDSLTTTAIDVVHPLKEEHLAVQADEQEVFDEIAEVATAPNETAVIETPIDEQETFDEIAELESPAPTGTSEATTGGDLAEQPADEQEIFDEIAELDVKEFVAAVEETEVQPEAGTAETTPQTSPIADDMAIGSIVATDFFAFEKSFKTEQGDTEVATTEAIAKPEEYDQEAEDQTVSKYNDDKLPYTFLWWLAKTRKEHEQIFQPYVTPKNPAPAPVTGELQHQYVEHIFHIQTPFTADEADAKGVAERPLTKGDEIIEAFIKSEPQIGPPKPEQINNENKAKKSAEDNYDLVSETLASIYIEQMLYHKAIDTYEKLSLKFPEKSRYFADLIQSLEKKI